MLLDIVFSIKNITIQTEVTKAGLKYSPKNQMVPNIRGSLIFALTLLIEPSTERETKGFLLWPHYSL